MGFWGVAACGTSRPIVWDVSRRRSVQRPFVWDVSRGRLIPVPYPVPYLAVYGVLHCGALKILEF